MNKNTIKAFIAWLDTASEDEIIARKKMILIQPIETPEGKADVKLALRLIDEELLARLEFGSVAKKG